MTLRCGLSWWVTGGGRLAVEWGMGRAVSGVWWRRGRASSNDDAGVVTIYFL